MKVISELYVNGSCLRNSGAGGLAYIIRYWDTPEGTDIPIPKTIDGTLGFRLTTNNRMEIMAAVYGIKAVLENLDKINKTKKINQISLYSTSEYLCNAINQGWINKWQQNNWMTSRWKGAKPQPVKNKDLWEQIIDLQKKLQDHMINLILSNVEGQCNEWSKKASNMAYQASYGNNLKIDEQYEVIFNRLNRR